MTDEIRAALCGALVGGLLAGGSTFISTWLLQKLQEGRQLNQKKDYFTQAIIDDLEVSISLYEKIKGAWDRAGTIWFDDTIELKERRQIYYRNQEWVLLYHTLQKSEKKFLVTM